MILQEKDIFKLIEEYEAQEKEYRQYQEFLLNQEHELKKGSFDRSAFYRSIISDQYKDGFIMEYRHGSVILQAKRKWYFRGERACYTTSQPTLIRNIREKPEIQKFILDFVAKAKLLQFNAILNQLDHYKTFKNISFWLPSGEVYRFKPLLSCIGQHYGFATNWLDITSDLNAALFFACCICEDGKWRPLTQKDIRINKHGRLFRKTNNLEFPNSKYEVLPIGFQPFMRCHMQYGYAVWMNDNMDLAQSESGFDIIQFHHSENLSEFIFDKMESGEKIYPHEGLSLIDKELHDLRTSTLIPKDIFHVTYNSMKKIEYSRDKVRRILKEHQYIVTKELWNFSSEKIDAINNMYQNFDIEKTYGIKLRNRLMYG